MFSNETEWADGRASIPAPGPRRRRTRHRRAIVIATLVAALMISLVATAAASDPGAQPALSRPSAQRGVLPKPIDDSAHDPTTTSGSSPSAAAEGTSVPIPGTRVGTLLSSRLGLCINGIVANTPLSLTDNDLDAAVRLGSGGIRIDVPWQAVEWGRNKWTFSGYDSLIRGAAKRGLRVDVILDYNNPLYGGHWNQLPVDLTAWGRYVSSVVARYRGQVTSYEVWNEPDVPMFNTDAADPSRYLKLLQATYGIVKRADPTALVVAAAMANPTASPPYWAAIARQAQPYFDIANLHIYGGDVAARVSATARMNPGKPIWVTELGHDSADETAQAAFLTQTVRYLRTHGVAAVWVFQLQDHQTAQTRRRYGMLDLAGRARPAAAAFRSLALGWRN